MNRAEFIFTLVDYGMKIPQNLKHWKGIIIEKNNSYCDKDKNCIADYYYKDKTQKKAVLLYVHGGGFVKGDKKYRVSYSEAFAAHGFFVFNANHRLSPQHNYPAQLFDICDMMNKLKDIADIYNLDLSRIVIGGDSSGGYLTAQYLASQYNDELRARLGLPFVQIKPSAYLGICSPYDVIKMMQSPTAVFGIGRVTGESFMGIKIKSDYSNITDYKYYNYISPIDYVNDSWCPCIVLYSAKDLFCYKQSEKFIEELKKHNVLHFVDKSNLLINNHCYQLILTRIGAKRALRKTFDALNIILKMEQTEYGNIIYKKSHIKQKNIQKKGFEK